MSRTVLLSGLVVPFMFCGCGEKPTPPAPQSSKPTPITPQVAISAASAPAPAASAPMSPMPGVAATTAPQTQASVQVTEAEYLESLNDAVGAFGREQKRPPNSVEELFDNKYIRRMPNAPAGKSFHFDTQKKHFVLISSQGNSFAPSAPMSSSVATAKQVAPARPGVVAAVAPPPPGATNGIPAPGQPGAPAAAPEAAQATSAEYLESLNDAVGAFGREQKRPPNGLEELIENKYIRRLPVPPPGMKFHFDSQKKHFVLISL